MALFEVHITGQVQGVGFRPFIYKMALSQNLKGYVLNDLDGVHVRFSAPSNDQVKIIVEEWLNKLPSQAIIDQIKISEVQGKPFDDFKIIMSSQKGIVTQSPSPDFAICQDCKNEMMDPKNRRHLYPFITCTNCGPRYSIMDGLPYDRELTSMDKFTQCTPCNTEYWNPLHRRFYSQTNSCHECGIEMKMINQQGKLISENTHDIPIKIAELLKKGFIVAVKGIGGYLLLADASNQQAIQKLRKRKRRPKKPFALMYPSIQKVNEDFILNNNEKRLLKSTAAPILLLESRSKGLKIQSNLLAPGLDKMGVMLPYTGLFVLLFKYFPHPIVATSGNITNEPIIIDDEDAKSKFHQVADVLVVHNRPIRFAADDSVINTTKQNKGIVIRRSRGMAPSLQSNIKFKIPKTVLAMGADLKSSFALHHLSKVYISQYLGNQSYFETQVRFENTLKAFLKMMRTKPDEILADKHPEYSTTRLGRKFSKIYNAELIPIQHHKAHFAAVLAENKIPIHENVLGVIWDGTGFGDDSHIWGGEFFDYRDREIRRISHFEYYDHLLGNSMPKKPGLCALSLAGKSKEVEDRIKLLFEEDEWKIYRQLKIDQSRLKTSSVGRVFDAVAGLLGLCKYNSFEGEAAMYLEVAARHWLNTAGFPTSAYLDNWNGEGDVPIKNMLRQIILDLGKAKPVNYIAAKFHLSLTKIIDIKAQISNYRKIAFSGGVFQNALLVDMIIKALSNKYELYFHKELSPNDECIPFGQLAYQYHYNSDSKKNYAYFSSKFRIMCLAIPGKIERIKTQLDDLFRLAEVDFGGIKAEVNLCMVPEAKIGDYVLVHVGVALSVVDEEEAHKTFDYLKQMGELDELEALK